MTDEWTLAKEARIAFADLCDTLTPEQLHGSTWCEGWNPQHVAAHVATFVEVPFPKFMFTIMKHRGDFDSAAKVMAGKIAEQPMADIVATIRAKAAKKAALPIFPGGLTLADVIVHTEDVRRGLGLDGAPDPALVRGSLEFMVGKKSKPLLETKGLLDGLRFEATDSDWTHGDGQLVRGPGLSILLAMVRRPAFDELTGDGVAVLQQRQQAKTA